MSLFVWSPLLPGGAQENQPPAGGTGQIKYWTGAAWTAKPVKYWDGGAWTTKPLKFWNGSTWTTTPY